MSLLDYDIREALRLLGCPDSAVPPASLLELIARAEKELSEVISVQSVIRKGVLSFEGRITVLDGLELPSDDLSSLLRGCEHGFVFAITLGPGVDALIRRISVTDIAMASVLHAVSAAVLEGFCDTLQNETASKFLASGLYPTERFSPGYGDLSLENQRNILEFLDAQKRCGITLTDSLMMLPRKSVTAVFGLSPDSAPSRRRCSSCQKHDCPYRSSSEGCFL